MTREVKRTVLEFHVGGMVFGILGSLRYVFEIGHHCKDAVIMMRRAQSIRCDTQPQHAELVVVPQGFSKEAFRSPYLYLSSASIHQLLASSPNHFLT
jgi:hypothetical protein